MDSTKRRALSLHLTEQQRRETGQRCHLEKEHQELLEKLYRELEPQLQPEVFWRFLPQDGGRVLCALTLGREPERLQEVYQEAQELLQIYLLDCLGSALLSEAYSVLGELLFGETGLFLNRLEFPGAQTPLEKLPQMLSLLSEGGIEPSVSCNEACMLYPKNSVVFWGFLEPEKRSCGLCEDCPAVNCPERNREERGDGA